MRRSSSVPSEPAPLPPVPLSRHTRYVTLPAAVDTLFGRDQEIADVVAALRSRSSRLLVLTGPGGVGKTRLAIASATAAANSFKDGELFVALAPIRAPALVATSIARAAGMREASAQPTSAWLAELLSDRDLLLLLDNFEHLLPASDLISGLLEACPKLTILMTSRTRPRLAGERDVPVHPLSLPPRQRPAALGPPLPATATPGEDSGPE